MKKFFLAIAICFVGISCSSDSNSDSGDDPDLSSFDRSEVLISLADDFIIPQFDTFLQDAKLLTEAKNTFVENSNETNLISLRTALTNAYTTFQPVATYADIGKAEELNYYPNLNAHALDVALTQGNIAVHETVNLASVFNQATQGLPAVDYLVNGLGDTDTEIVAFYLGEEAENYKGYLSIVIDRIENLTQQVVDDWANGYRSTFVENTSSSSAGSFDIFINKYIEYFERRLRASKVGIPAGVFTANPFPEQIESLYNPTLSRSLLVATLDNSEAIYLGKDSSNASLSSILVELGSTELDNLLKGYFNDTQTQIDEKLDDNLQLQVITDNSKMLEVRDALQRVVATMKVDMTSVLGVDITFQDNDGD